MRPAKQEIMEVLCNYFTATEYEDLSQREKLLRVDQVADDLLLMFDDPNLYVSNKQRKAEKLQ